jgi:maltose-binding protein MalE
MHKLVLVEEAKTLFNEAKDWSVWRWLIEKKRARTTADAAWEALEACDEKVRAGWNEEWRQAYGHPKSRRYAALDDEVKAALERLYEDDEEAKQAHDAAEAQFDEADRRMSSSMACEGAQMAIDAWEMREKVIRKAEALARRK